ncbi:MAG: 30S ribosomal protein S17 [Rickettsiaceae bacterium H1]|nr:30S ribosomal protein S17 [Rickettsiaceae bacterium H1]
MSKSLLNGIVVKDVCDKTITVVVLSKVWHNSYKKIIKSRKKYLVHDENNQYHVGDSVMVKNSIPISKKKRWIVIGEKK